MPVFYQPTIGKHAKTFTNVQQLANAVAKACSILKAMEVEIGTAERPILVNQVALGAVPLQLPQPSFRQFDCHRSMDHSQEGQCKLSADG
uniref:Uncharacterized protein n=1 Tax=Romanomermis culicivorax TaxID=13658 RepID=A0A915KRB9_ROMCU